MSKVLKTPEFKKKREKVAYYITLATMAPFQFVLIVIFAYSISHTDVLFAIGILAYPVIVLHEFLIVLLSVFFYWIWPLIPIYFVQRKGKVVYQTTQREDRGFILGIGSIGYFFAIIVYIWLDAILLVNLRVFIIFSVSYLIIALVNLLVTAGFKFKTSLHMSGATNAITMLYISYGFFSGAPAYQLFFLLYFCLPVIAWAKWRMHESFQQGHTIPQLISGFFIGLIGTCITIFIFILIGMPIVWFAVS